MVTVFTDFCSSSVIIYTHFCIISFVEPNTRLHIAIRCIVRSILNGIPNASVIIILNVCNILISIILPFFLITIALISCYLFAYDLHSRKHDEEFSLCFQECSTQGTIKVSVNYTTPTILYCQGFFIYLFTLTFPEEKNIMISIIRR